VIEEQPHAQRLGSLSGHQAYLAADVVAIFKPLHLCFIALGIAFQTRDALFNRLTKPGAYLEGIVGSAVSEHRGFL
jgi:hypothetical protein